MTAETKPPAVTSTRSRGIAILAGLALLQSALIAWLFWPQQAQATAGPLFAGFDPAQISRVTIDGEGESLTLARAADGWVLPDRGDYPANAIAVSDLLTKVAQIETSRLVAGSAASHERLQVDERAPNRRVAMTTEDGRTFTLLLGSSPNARATNVRAGGSDNVYLTGALSAGDVRVDLPAWAGTQYLSLAPEAVDGLRIKNATGDYALARAGASGWTLPDLQPGEQVVTDTVNTLVRTVANLSLNDVLGREPLPAYGLEPPTTTVTLALAPITATTSMTDAAAPAEAVQLLIGARDAETGSYVVKASSSPWYVRVTGATLDPIVQAQRADLVAAISVTATQAITAFAPLTETTPLTP